MSTHYFVKCRTCLVDQSYIESYQKLDGLENNQLLFTQKLEFQISSLTRTVKLVTVTFQYFYANLSHHPPCSALQPMSQQIADAAGTDVMLLACSWYTDEPDHFMSSQE